MRLSCRLPNSIESGEFAMQIAAVSYDGHCVCLIVKTPTVSCVSLSTWLGIVQSLMVTEFHGDAIKRRHLSAEKINHFG